MRIGTKSQNEFLINLNKKNDVIQNNFLNKIMDTTKVVDVKVMLGDSTVKTISTFDPTNIENFFNKFIESLNDWESQGISYSYNDDVRRIFLKFEIKEDNLVLSVHISVQFHVLLYYKPEQNVIELQKELAEVIDKTQNSDLKYSDDGNKIILQKLQELGYDKINKQNLFELFYNDPKLSEMLSEKIETSLEDEIIELNSRKKIILNKLDDLLLETFQTTGILIDEQKLINGEEGCLCNIDLEYIENGAKQGLFDLDTVDAKSQEKIGYRLNQIFKFLEN